MRSADPEDAETRGANRDPGGAPADVLELLLPDARAPVVDCARRLVTFLRLLVADGHAPRACTVRVDLPGATRELASVSAARLVARFEDLLRHHLGRSLGGETFAWYCAPGLGADGTWADLARQREEWPGLTDADWPGAPAPGEAPAAVAARLLTTWGALMETGDRDALEGTALRGRHALWQARLIRTQEGPRAGEAAARALLSGGLEASAFAERLEAAGDAAAALLDRGAVRAALDLLDENLALVSCSEHLARLYGWSHLLLGEVEVARETLGSLPPWTGPLPAPLFALRARRPDWLRWLSGRAPEAPATVDAPPPEVPERLGVGACVAIVLGLGPGRETRLLSVDIAPALRDRLDDWLRDRDGACAVAAEPEHRLVVGARAVVEDRADGDRAGLAPRGALAPGARAVVRQPVLDSTGEVAGWIHLEFEHHLAPSPARLAALAAGARAAVFEAGGHGEVEPIPGGRSRDARAAERPRPGLPVVPEDEPCAARVAALAALALSLAMKTSQRRVFGLDVEDGEPALVLEQGGALDDWARVPGGHRALRRALRTGGVVAWEAPDPGLSIHAEAGSGVVVPVRTAGRTCALLVVESLRRKDFGTADHERFAAFASEHGPALHVAQFRDWHRRRFGHDVVFDASASAFGPRVPDVVAAGATRAPIALTGPAGVGKQVVARWVHFESDRRHGELTVFPCGALSPAATAARLCGDATRPSAVPGLLETTRGGTLVLDDVDRLPTDVQADLLAWLTGREARRGAVGEPGELPPRLVVTAREPLPEAVVAGRLREDLAQRLDRLQIHLPPLCDRRDEIPALIDCLLTRFAEEEGARPVGLDDRALALLWRQPWRGNVCELENLLYKLALLHPGEALGEESLRATARRYQLDLEKRLPSRHPRAMDVEAALRVTRKSTGNPNKTRAAMYLGWDPDTLVARMRDLGLGR